MVVWQVLQKSLMITAFVAVMMLVIEYANVQTRGFWLRQVGDSRWVSYLVAALLGAIPGCMGAFVLVALYVHRRVTLGAVVTGMIVTSGDETFVMLALFPATTLWMTAALVPIGVIAGWLTDVLRPRWSDREHGCSGLVLHEEERCSCFSQSGILGQWRAPTPYRATLTVSIAVFALALAFGAVGPPAWGWKRVTLLLVAAMGLFVVITVPDHFLEEHLWAHVARAHVPRVFAWTIGTLAVLAVVNTLVDLGAIVQSAKWLVLALAVVVGVIPESGPHLVFVTTFADGVLPLSILVASSIVQDGHGMLPLLAHSRRDFLIVKGINALVGAIAGGAMLGAGW